MGSFMPIFSMEFCHKQYMFDHTHTFAVVICYGTWLKKCMIDV